jgi:hypothetical protein
VSTQGNQPERIRERETIVTDGGGRSNMGGVVVAILAVVAIVVLMFFMFDRMGSDGDGTPVIPDDIDVNIDDDSGDGGGDDTGGDE